MRKRLYASYPLLLSALLLAPLLPVLLAPAGRVLGNPACDNPAAFYYYNAFAGRCWRQGVIPLWNPHIMLGMPFLGEGQAAIFHPLSWLFALLPTGVAINWLIAISLLLTALFYYGYLRALRLSREGAFCGALVWGFSSAMITRIHAGHLTVLLTLIEVPLLLLLWERYRAAGRGQGRGCLIGIALAYGAMILAAHPQILYLFSLFFAWYVLAGSVFPSLFQSFRARARARARNRNRNRNRQAQADGAPSITITSTSTSTNNRLGMLVGCVLLGIGIGAVQLLPMADFASVSFRRVTSLAFCGSYSFNPENFWLMLVPRFFGLASDPGPGQFWANHNYWEMLYYIGVLPLLLLPAGLAAASPRRRLALGGGAVIFAVLALGEYTPLFPLFYHGLPLFTFFRVPARAMLVAQFCLVTLGAHGIESLLHGPAETLRRRLARPAWLLAALMLAALAAAYVYLCLPQPDAPGSHWLGFIRWICRPAAGGAIGAGDFTPEMVRQTAQWAGSELLRAMGLVALGGGLIALACRARWRRLVLPLTAALLLADLAGVYLPLLLTYDESITLCPEERVAPVRGLPYPARVFDPVATENITMLTGLSSPAGYAANTLARYSRFVNLAQGLPADNAQTHNQLKTYAPLIRHMAPDAVFVPERGAKPGMPVLARKPGVWALVRYPEALPRAYLAESPQGAASEEEALRRVLAPGADPRRRPVIEKNAEAAAESGPLAPGEGARVVAFEPNRVELEARAARPRMLILCEMYEKNWTARVNGAARPVYPANSIFRAVAVPAGRSRVVFEYCPAAFRWGAAITLASLASLALCAGWLAGRWCGKGRRLAA